MTATHRHRWWILLVTTSATSLVFLDNTVMPIALPSIQNDLGFSDLALVWVVNAYLLSLTAFLLVSGRLSDLFGRKLLFITGLALFGVGSVLGAIGLTKWMLILGRVIQGVGGSMTIPTTAALIVSSFPIGQRAKAIGINTGISSIFLILGPAVGGFLTQYLGWRSIFYLNVPLVLFGMVMAFLVLKHERRKKESFHFTGAVTMLVGIVCLVVGLMQSTDWGWLSWKTLGLIGVSPLFFALFVNISKHTSHPLLDFSLFKNHLFSVANISLFIAQIIVMVNVLWAIYFQEELNYSPSETGLIIFFAAFPVFMMAPLAGYLSDRLGPRWPLLIGFTLLLIGLSWLIFTAHAKKMLLLLPGLVCFGGGFPMIMSPAIVLALSQVDPAKLGAASGITTETRQLAATVGIALMSAIFYFTLNRTGSNAHAFSAISLGAALFALLGLILVFWKVKAHEVMRK